MHVSMLALRDFRNYQKLDLALDAGTTLFYGPNAAGKTSLLEALFFLATTRSTRSSSDRELVRWDATGDLGFGPFARVAAEVCRVDGRVRLEVVVQRRSDEEGGAASKTVRIDRKQVRALDLVGQLRVVLFTPNDLALISGPPAERRRYLDVTLSQLGGRYVRTLAHYNRVVQQRNSLLRAWRERRRPLRGADDELAFWDRELSLAGTYLLHERRVAVAEINTLVGPIYCAVTGTSEPLTASYQASVPGLAEQHDERDIEQAFLARLHALRDDEIGRGQTLIGPHRDDLVLTAGGISLGVYGSRGQQRSATLALKLGEAALMQRRSGENPVLLLDDVLSELDPERRSHLLAAIGQPEQQTLITATDLGAFDASFLGRARLARVEGGRVYGM